jgi:hypothetical protein
MLDVGDNRRFIVHSDGAPSFSPTHARVTGSSHAMSLTRGFRCRTRRLLARGQPGRPWATGKGE